MNDDMTNNKSHLVLTVQYIIFTSEKLYCLCAIHLFIMLRNFHPQGEKPYCLSAKDCIMTECNRGLDVITLWLKHTMLIFYYYSSNI